MLLGWLPVNITAVPDTMISGPPTSPSHVARRGTRPELYQVAEDQPVPPADDPAWAEEERPVLDRGEGVGDTGAFRRHLFRSSVMIPRMETMPTRMNVHSNRRAVT